MDDYDSLKKDVSENFIQKDTRDIKRSMGVDMSYRPTIVFVAAVSNDEDKNKILFIPCYGSPVTHDVYDSARDGFVLCAQDFYKLGEIPISYRLELEESEWSSEIPLPMTVIKRYLTEKQKIGFAEWKSKFGKDSCVFITAQMLGVYR